MTSEEIGVKLVETEQRSKSNSYRLKKVEERQDNLDSLVKSVAVMASEQEHIKCDVTEIKGDVKALAEKPGKRWDGLVDKIVWAIAAALVAFILTQMGVT